MLLTNRHSIYRFFKLLFKPKSAELLTSNSPLKVPKPSFSLSLYLSPSPCNLAVLSASWHWVWPSDIELGHLISFGHWNANRHDAIRSLKYACLLGLLLPPLQNQALAGLLVQGRCKTCRQETQTLLLPPQPPQDEMKPLQPTCRPLRINDCCFKILGF